MDILKKKLIKDITGSSRRDAPIKAKKGEVITLISISGNAVIIENKKGERLPTNIKNIEWK